MSHVLLHKVLKFLNSRPHLHRIKEGITLILVVKTFKKHSLLICYGQDIWLQTGHNINDPQNQPAIR